MNISHYHRTFPADILGKPCCSCRCLSSSQASCCCTSTCRPGPRRMRTGLCSDRSKPLDSDKDPSLLIRAMLTFCTLLAKRLRMYILEPESAVLVVEHKLDCAAASNTTSGRSHVKYIVRTREIRRQPRLRVLQCRLYQNVSNAHDRSNTSKPKEQTTKKQKPEFYMVDACMWMGSR